MDTRLWFDLPAVVRLAEHAASCATFTGDGDGDRRPCLLIDGPPAAVIRSNGRATDPAPDPVDARYIDGGTEPPDDDPTAAICLPLTHTDPDDEMWHGPALLDQLRYAAGAAWFIVTIHADTTVDHATGHTRQVDTVPARATWVPAHVEAGPPGPYPAQIAHGYHRPGGHAFARFRRDIAWWIALDLHGQPAGPRPAAAVRVIGEQVALVHHAGTDVERVEPLTADPGGWWRIDGDAWPWTITDDDPAVSPGEASVWQTWGPDGEQRCTVCHAVDEIDSGELPSMVGYGLDTWSRCRRCGSTETSDPMFGLHTRPAPWPPPRQRQDELDAQSATGDQARP